MLEKCTKKWRRRNAGKSWKQNGGEMPERNMADEYILWRIWEETVELMCLAKYWKFVNIQNDVILQHKNFPWQS